MEPTRTNLPVDEERLTASTPPPVLHPRDPLHGITLENILTQLVQRHGWAEMARRIPIRCFLFDPSIKSSLNFLRKTPWARQKIERWFIGELAAGKIHAEQTRQEPPQQVRAADDPV